MFFFTNDSKVLKKEYLSNSKSCDFFKGESFSKASMASSQE